jgi:hypothetical protein
MSYTHVVEYPLSVLWVPSILSCRRCGEEEEEGCYMGRTSDYVATQP